MTGSQFARDLIQRRVTYITAQGKKHGAVFGVAARRRAGSLSPKTSCRLRRRRVSMTSDMIVALSGKSY
jgi:hypothetical protein